MVRRLGLSLGGTAAAERARAAAPRWRRSRNGRSRWNGPAVVSVCLAITAVLPQVLLGALAPEIRADLGMGTGAFGAVVTGTYLCAGLSAFFVRRFVQSAGPRACGVGAILGVSALLAGSALAPTALLLAALQALVGLALAAAQIASNMTLATAVSAGRQGLAFGVKQAGTPAAGTLVGGAVPVLLGWFGWRGIFGIMSLLVLGLVAPARRSLPSTPSGRRGDITPLPRTRRTGLILLSAAGLIGAASMAASAIFLVDTAVARGQSLTWGATVLAGTSAVTMLMRMVQGWRADRRGGQHLRSVSRLMAAGAVGYSILAVSSSPWHFVVGATLAQLLGNGWNGLIHFAVVHYHRMAPAAASSLTQSGMFLGGAFGAVLFGNVAEHFSYRAAWFAGAGALVVASGLVLLSRILLRRGLAGEELDAKDRLAAETRG